MLALGFVVGCINIIELASGCGYIPKVKTIKWTDKWTNNWRDK
jgi:hypothetical protein